ncbi:MAG: hypothetical protein KatS3mg102_2372 [Planctomycetota bacterium]|nr:MAG: hypothetical protein KatS3mg102_2372 [Planctomycetota bacterium]
MGVGKVGQQGFDPSQQLEAESAGLQASPAQIGAEPGPAALESPPSPALDPSQAAQQAQQAQQAWQAHSADPGAAILQNRFEPGPADVQFTPDWLTLEEFYAEAPPEVRELDQLIALTNRLLDEIAAHLERAQAALGGQPEAGQIGAPPAPGGATPLGSAGTAAQQAQAVPGGAGAQALQQDAAAGGVLALSPEQRLAALRNLQLPPQIAGAPPGEQSELREALIELARELSRERPDPARVRELAERVDRVVAAIVAGGDPARLERVREQLGSSVRGGGAVGGRIDERTRIAASTPPGYERLDGARDGFYLARGARGPEVEALQHALNRAGYGPLEVDGALGPATEAAIRGFQQEHGCRVDGIVGPETMGALDVALGLPRRSGPGVPRADYQTPGPVPPGRPVAPGRTNRIGALQAALTQIGVREASGNNDGVPARRYSGGREVPWCANFVSWAFRQAGTPLPGNQWSLGSCDYMMNQLKQNGVWFDRGQGMPQPGDIIMFGRPGDATHVGIVERVEGGRVYTVEGNSGNRVARRSYDLDSSRILGYGRP